MSGYYHVQRGLWSLVCYALFVVSLIASNNLPVPGLQITFCVVGAFLLLLGASIGHLVVEDEGEQLFIHFGPFPLIRKRIRYADIREVERGRLPFHERAGIHWTPGKGWTWSLGGRDCVVVWLERGAFRVGTDDAERLAGFLQGRIAATELARSGRSSGRKPG